MKKKMLYIIIVCMIISNLLSCNQMNNNNQIDIKNESNEIITTNSINNNSYDDKDDKDDDTDIDDFDDKDYDDDDNDDVINYRTGFSIRKISDDLLDRMKQGNTFKEECIVPSDDLRYLLVLHKDINGNTHQGEMVVHKLIANDVLEIFEKLYDAGYPIERMVLPDNYMADDEIMMRDNNSSSFNFRFISHTNKISKHGLGMAVDINTLYNPFHKIVNNDDGTQSEVIEPATGKEYLDRNQKFDYKIEKGDLCYTLFTEKGFEWGGDWTSVKDYQHFELPSEITDKYTNMYVK